MIGIERHRDKNKFIKIENRVIKTHNERYHEIELEMIIRFSYMVWYWIGSKYVAWKRERERDRKINWLRDSNREIDIERDRQAERERVVNPWFSY